MRKTTQTIYKYDELPEQGKGKAFHQWLSESGYDGSENEATLKAFEKIFPVHVRNWSYGERGRDYIKWDFADYRIEKLSGIRLLTYLSNNYFHDLWKGKYYSTAGHYDENQKYHYKKRYSRVMFENSCVLTGVWIDDELLQPLYDFMKKPSEHTTFHDLMHECLESWLTACTGDYENYYSEESFKDLCEGNEWEFTEDGAFYH